MGFLNLDTAPPAEIPPPALIEVPPTRPSSPWRTRFYTYAAAVGFLVTGCAIGLLIAAVATVRALPPRPPDPYALSLSVLEYGDNLHLRWDRNCPAVRAAKRATLYITDGGQSRSLDLSPTQLRTGSVIYRRLTQDVKLKLELAPTEKRRVSETWGYRELPTRKGEYGGM
jgi:hypothetical protein